MNNMKLPVGISDFHKLRQNEYYYVDKTNLIKELLESRIAEVTLITRPRRFGKRLIGMICWRISLIYEKTAETSFLKI